MNWEGWRGRHFGLFWLLSHWGQYEKLQRVTLCLACVEEKSSGLSRLEVEWDGILSAHNGLPSCSAQVIGQIFGTPECRFWRRLVWKEREQELSLTCWSKSRNYLQTNCNFQYNFHDCFNTASPGFLTSQKIFMLLFSCTIWSSHTSGYEEFYLLGYNAVYSVERQPTLTCNGLESAGSQKIRTFLLFYHLYTYIYLQETPILFY
jgi:hypothetical protein